MLSLSRRRFAVGAGVVAAAVLSLTGAGTGHLSAQAPLPSAATNAHLNAPTPIRINRSGAAVHVGTMAAPAPTKAPPKALPRLDPYAATSASSAAQTYRSAAAAALPAGALNGTPITLALPSLGPLVSGATKPGARPAAGPKFFNGLDSFDNAVATNSTLEPPDQGLCANKDFTLELINDTGRMYKAGGAPLTNPFALSTFLGDGTNLSDPRCYYDPLEDAWFASILGYTFDGSGNITESHFDVFWSISHDPSAPTWLKFQLDTSNPTGASDNGCPCLADQPLLGVSAFAVYLQGNLFTSALTGFEGSTVWMLSKQQMLAGFSPGGWYFPDITLTNAFGSYPVASLQPAQTADPNAPGENFLATLNFFGGPERALFNMLITNEAAVDSSFESPLLLGQVLFGQFYAPPPCARQPSSGFCIDSGDNRMMQVQWVPNSDQKGHAGDGTLWGGFNTLGRFASSTTQQTMVATDWIHPVVTTDSLGNPVFTSTILAQGKFGLTATHSGDSTSMMYPAIATGKSGQPFLIAGGMRTDLAPSVITATLTTVGGFTTATGAAIQTGAGNDQGFTCTDPRTGFVCRWGDYSAAMTIYDISKSQGNPTALPAPTGVIAATETISPRLVKDGSNNVLSNWGTQIDTLQ